MSEWSKNTLFDNGAKINYDDYVGFGITNPLDSIHTKGAIIIGNATANVSGSIRWTGTDFEGYVSNVWKSLTTNGLSNNSTGESSNSLNQLGGIFVNGNAKFNENVGIGITASDTSKLYLNADTVNDEALKIYGKTQVNGNITPEINNTYDLGSSTKGWKNVYMDTAILTKGVQLGNALPLFQNGWRYRSPYRLGLPNRPRHTN